MHSLTPFSILYMLRSRAKAAGVAKFGSHDFRRTFITEMLERYDVSMSSKLVNHVDAKSTLLYDLRGAKEQRKAVSSVDLPSIDELLAEASHDGSTAPRGGDGNDAANAGSTGTAA